MIFLLFLLATLSSSQHLVKRSRDLQFIDETPPLRLGKQFSRDWKIVKLITESEQATIYKVVNAKHEYAVIKIPGTSISAKRMFATEKRILNVIKAAADGVGRQFVLKLLRPVKEHGFEGLLVEYANAGDLFDFVYQRELTQQQIGEIFAKIVLGVKYLHSIGVVHRDLKPESNCNCN